MLTITFLLALFQPFYPYIFDPLTYGFRHAFSSLLPLLTLTHLSSTSSSSTKPPNTLQITINRRVVNKYYSDLGMWDRRYRHEILFLLLSLCWWSSGHFSLVCVIAKFFIFYSSHKLLCAHSSYAAALHCFQTFLTGMICELHQLSVCALFRPLTNMRLTAISYVSSTEINE